MSVKLQKRGLQQRVYEVIRDDDQNTLLGNIFDGVIFGLIVLNLIAVVLGTFTLKPTITRILSVFELCSVIIFTVEYLLRVWTSPCIYPLNSSFVARGKYMFSFMALVDLLAVLPFYVPFLIPLDLRILRVLRMIRLLRLLKVNRYTDALQSIASVFRKKARHLISSIIVVSVTMLVVAVLMFHIENASQPDVFRNVFDALWWAVATFTTVGYGDIYPITGAGKLLSAVIAILGIVLVAVPTGIISAGFIENIEHKHEEKCFCPYCGKQL